MDWFGGVLFFDGATVNFHLCRSRPFYRCETDMIRSRQTRLFCIMVITGIALTGCGERREDQAVRDEFTKFHAPKQKFIRETFFRPIRYRCVGKGGRFALSAVTFGELDLQSQYWWTEYYRAKNELEGVASDFEALKTFLNHFDASERKPTIGFYNPRYHAALRENGTIAYFNTTIRVPGFTLPFVNTDDGLFLDKRTDSDQYEFLRFGPSQNLLFPDAMELTARRMPSSSPDVVSRPVSYFFDPEKGYCVGLYATGSEEADARLARYDVQMSSDDEWTITIETYSGLDGRKEPDELMMRSVVECTAIDDVDRERCFLEYYGLEEPESGQPFNWNRWWIWLTAVITGSVLLTGLIALRKRTHR